MVDQRYRVALAVVTLAIPAFVAYQVYAGMTREPQAPNFPRTVHPASPDSITVHDKELALNRLDNPYRPLQTQDPAAFQEHVAAGRQVYYQNCFYCHGDLLTGQGMFAHGLNPIPTNFQDPSVIPILQEGFLFWRISKGAPGLPEEAGPWDSAMPAWESFLSEDDMWNVILFLTDFTGYTVKEIVPDFWDLQVIRWTELDPVNGNDTGAVVDPSDDAYSLDLTEGDNWTLEFTNLSTFNPQGVVIDERDHAAIDRGDRARVVADTHERLLGVRQAKPDVPGGAHGERVGVDRLDVRDDGCDG